MADAMALPVGIRYNPLEHLVTETPFANYMRKYMQDPDIFCYRHRKTGNFMMAVWVVKDKRLYELANLGKSPGGSRQVKKDIKNMLLGDAEGDANRTAIQKHLSTDQERYTKELQEDHDEMQEARKAVARKLEQVGSRHGKTPLMEMARKWNRNRDVSEW